MKKFGWWDCTFRNPKLLKDVVIAFLGSEEAVNAAIDEVRKLSNFTASVYSKATLYDARDVGFVDEHIGELLMYFDWNGEDWHRKPFSAAQLASRVGGTPIRKAPTQAMVTGDITAPFFNYGNWYVRVAIQDCEGVGVAMLGFNTAAEAGGIKVGHVFTSTYPTFPSLLEEI
jgi:hypothetical protein